MTTRAALDPRAILATLGYDDDIRAIAPVTGGMDAAIWRVDRPEGSYALRVFGPNRERDRDREVAVLAAYLPGVPLPRLYASGAWQGHPAMLIGWCPGEMLFAALQARPWQLPALAAEFGRVQAHLHAAPVPEALRELSRDWIDWKRGGDGPLGVRLRAVATERPAILHGDYHPLNVMMEGGRVGAVLDWTNVQVGDPRADLARTVTILRLSPAPEGFPVPLFHLALRLLEQNWRRGYRSVAGPLGGMAPFYAWAGVAMINDLSPRLGKDVTEGQLAAVRRWVAYWEGRAGI